VSFSEGDKFIGKYPLLKLLGKGGMGEVWLSHHPGLDLPVAVKMMKSLNSESLLRRFILEGRLAASINHENIVRVYDADSDGDAFFLVMEYIKGEDYKSFAQKNGGSISIEQGVEMSLAVCKALSKAHENRIFHRDIKPENIMRSEAGEIKLADLGIAKRDDSEFQNTMANTPLGTPYYMSPEQANDASSVDCRTDIYSLGATLYYLLTGTYPFKASTPMQMLLKHINEALEEPIKRNPKIPQKLSQIICKMMEKDRAVRYQNCDEVYQAILDFKESYDGDLGSIDNTHIEASEVTEKDPISLTAETVLDTNQTVTQLDETQKPISENEKKVEKPPIKYLPFYITLAVIFAMFIIYTFKDEFTKEANNAPIVVNDAPVQKNNDQGVTEVLNIPTRHSAPPSPVTVVDPPKPVDQVIVQEKKSDPLAEVNSEIIKAYNLLQNNDALSFLQRYTHPEEARQYNIDVDSVYLNWFTMYQKRMFMDGLKEIQLAKPVHVGADLISFKTSQKFSNYLINAGHLPNINVPEVDRYINFKKYNGKWYISEDDRNPLLKYSNPVYDDLTMIASMLKHRKINEVLMRYSHPFETSEIPSNLEVLQNEKAFLLYIVLCLDLKRQNPIQVNQNAVSFKTLEGSYLNFQKYNGKWYAMDDESSPF
jgi:serine/threonine protein kinase